MRLICAYPFWLFSSLCKSLEDRSVTFHPWSPALPLILSLPDGLAMERQGLKTFCTNTNLDGYVNVIANKGIFGPNNCGKALKGSSYVVGNVELDPPQDPEKY
jgi:hypothetical protein